MMRILIADDHAVVRQGVKRILDDMNGSIVVEEASNGRELLAQATTKTWDVVLLDISMPGRNGLEVLRQLKSLYPALPVLVFSMHPEDQYAVRAFKAGAAGYLTKDSIPDELVTAIRRVVGGRHYVSAALAEYLVLEVTHDPDTPLHARLSDRELQVLCMLGSGRTVTDIAAELSLSIKTISTYRSRILEKMHLRSNAELIHYAVRHQLVD
jgi:two-component system, NarL family, invasion response regulator UvrY